LSTYDWFGVVIVEYILNFVKNMWKCMTHMQIWLFVSSKVENSMQLCDFIQNAW
jgi:hypothetical protein